MAYKWPDSPDMGGGSGYYVEPRERVLFTFPGKLGDALHQWPIAKTWAEENNQKIEVGLGRTAWLLEHLLAAQPCVSRVHRLEGITNEDVGGQPWHFSFVADNSKEWDRVVHLGFRGFPTRGLMRETYDLVPLKTPFEQIFAQPSIEPYWRHPGVDFLPLILHGNKTRPTFYKAMIRCWRILEKNFNPIVWAGKPDEWPQPSAFEGDGLPIAEVAARISVSGLVFAASSGIAALAGAQGAPCIRIGEPNLVPHEIWNNPGPNQWSVKPDEDPMAVLKAVLAEAPWKLSEVS